MFPTDPGPSVSTNWNTMDHRRCTKPRVIRRQRPEYSGARFVLLLLGLFLTQLTLTFSTPSASSGSSQPLDALIKEAAASPSLSNATFSTTNRTYHLHPHHLHHKHHPHSKQHNTTTTNTSSVDGSSHSPHTLLHLLEPSEIGRDPHLLPLPGSAPVDPQLLPASLDGSPVDLSNLNPKGLKFEEEPSDSYIVRSKSAILRCKTLNALNAWFSCNSGDERKIQSNQKISNYVDPEKGIRMIEIDLEVSRSDVEEHTNSGYTNPFQCWCTAYGGQHQIMSRKASVSFSFLKKHFYNEPLSRSVPVGSTQIMFDCLPPEGDPQPIVFWMKNEVIIAETQPKSFANAKSSVGTTVVKGPPKKYGKISKSMQFKGGSKVNRKLKQRSIDETTKTEVEVAETVGHHPEGHEAFPDPYGAQQNSGTVPKMQKIPQNPKPAPESQSEGDEEEDDEEYEDDDEEEDDPKKVKDHDEGDLLPLNFDDPPPLDANYLMTHDYSLVIQKVSLTDQGNYSCGVKNPAGTRFSAPASLTVFVNGEWSNWGSWSSCHLPTGQKCGRGTQKRVRHCSNPTPINNAQFCPGEPVQVIECNVICSSIVGGSYWSPWSDWSPCGHDCTQVRRRVCNNPTPEIGAHDCFGPDFMVRNCTGGLCRKIYDSNHPPSLFPFSPNPSGPIDQPRPSPGNHEQIYFGIIFILTLIIVLCIVYIGLKFVNRRRHRGAKSGFHSSTNGWTDMLQLERGGNGSDEDAQAMLMLLQQQQSGSLPGGPGVHLPMSGLGSAQMARYQAGRHQQNLRSLPFGTTTSSSSSASSNGNSTAQPEKYQFISRLKHNISGTSKPNLLLDHLVLRGQESGHPPLPTIPSINSLHSFATGSSINKYEEPIFPVGLRSPHPGGGTHYLHGKPPLPPITQPTASALSNTSGSNNTATISTNTTNTSESENNESEPDYAEPIINYGDGSGSGALNGPRPPSVPPPITSSTPLLPRSQLTTGTAGSSHLSASSTSASPELAFGKHEKFIKLTSDLLERGHYSMMPNLGVGIYLTPGFITSGSGYAYSTTDLYLRYGIDTSAKLSTSGLMYSSLSSVVTVAFSKSPGTGPVPPGTASAELLTRPFVLCFKHCIAVRGNSVASLAKMLGAKNLTVLWQDLEHKATGSGSSGQWTEVVRYGEENLNTACYLEFDANYVYLVSKYVGRYMLCIKSDTPGSTRLNHGDSLGLGSPGPAIDFSKLVNFSLSIEQISSSEHLVKVYCYDNLPSSTLSLRNELAPSGAAANHTSGTIRFRLGKSSSTSALRLSSRGGSLFFELKPPDRTRHRIKGLHRVEVPLNQIWFGSGSPVHCSFIVTNNSTVIRECTRKQCGNGIYENEFIHEEELDESTPDSDSDEIVTETDPESVAEEVRPLSGAKLDHFHETEADLNYEVKVWQAPKTGASSTATPISNVVTLNGATTVRLCQPTNTSPYYIERSLRHLFTGTDLAIRDELIDHLDQPRSDQLDWRCLASAAGFDHYLPYFATQPSPSTSILELWEAKVLNTLVPKPRTGSGLSSTATIPDLIEVKTIFYSKLVHLLQTIQRTDLIEIILSNQC